MKPPSLIRPAVWSPIVLALTLAIASACAAPPPAGIPPAPVLTLWPDPTFTAGRQCHGDYRAEDLDRYLPRARVAMWLPGTQSVTLDPERGCLVIRVESYGSGRLAELVLRGVAVPRHAVLLLVG